MLGYRAIIWDMSNLLGIVSLKETDYFSSSHSMFFFFSRSNITGVYYVVGYFLCCLHCYLEIGNT